VEDGSLVKVSEALARHERVDLRPAVGEGEGRQLQRESERVM
jgi:hypothetical protein